MAKSIPELEIGRSLPYADRSRGLRLRHAARQLVLGVVITLALAFLPTASYSSPPAGRHVVIVESKNAAGKIERQRLIQIVDQVCMELHIGESAVPQIVVIHLSNDEARAGGVPVGTTVMVERSFLSVDSKDDAMAARFLVWMVGRPDDAMIVGAVAHVVRMHLQLELSDQDLLVAEKRILQRLNATVDVNSFVKPRR